MRRLAMIVALVLVVAACGDDTPSIDFSTTTSRAVPIPSFTTTTAAAPITATPTTASPGTTAATGGEDDLPAGTPYTAYELVTDGAVEVEVPVEWFDRTEGVFIVDDREVGPLFAASTDYDGLINSFTTPGVFIGASADPAVTSEAIFAMKDFSGGCTPGGREVYDDGEYVGHVEYWFDCDGTQSDFVVIVAQPYDLRAILLVEVTLVTDADLEALERVLATWRLVGDL